MNKKLTNKNIYRLIEGLSLLSQLEIPDFKTSYSIDRNLNKLKPLKSVYEKCFSSLLKKFKAKTEDAAGEKFVVENNEYVFPSKKERESFIQERLKLDNTDLEEKIFEIKISSLQDVKNMRPVILTLLEGIIVHDIEL